MFEYLFNKVAGAKTCNSVKKGLQHRCFPVKIAKFLITLFYRTPALAASRKKVEKYLGFCQISMRDLFVKIVIAFSRKLL